MSEGEATAWLPSPGITTVLCNTSLGLPAPGAALETPPARQELLPVQALRAAWGVQVVVFPGLWAALPGGPNAPCPAVPEKLDPESLGSSNNDSYTASSKGLLG